NGLAIASGEGMVPLRTHEVTQCHANLEGRAPGCADGTREGFLDEVAFPNVAACGDPQGNKMSYAEAKSGAMGLCDPGWRWCTPGGISALPDQPTPTWGDATITDPCAWVSRETDSASCEKVALAVGGGCLLTLAEAGLSGSGECVANTCESGWRVATTLHMD